MEIKVNCIYFIIFYLINCMNSVCVRNFIKTKSSFRSNVNYIHPYYFEYLKNKATKIYKKHNTFPYNILNNENTIVNKKIISISPGGFLGFYIFGTCTYIKENYDLTNFIFSGASAGAWNSLYMSFIGEPNKFVLDIIEETKRVKKIIDIERNIKKNILSKYNESDFNLEKLFLGVTTLNNFQIYTNIYSNFDGLEDALDCCIASSHIPFINGPIVNKYKNVYTFDGGFSKNPYLLTKSVLHITPSMWQEIESCNKKKDECQNLINNSFNNSIFYREKYDFWNLFEKGYNDAKKNKIYLDNVLLE